MSHAPRLARALALVLALAGCDAQTPLTPEPAAGPLRAIGAPLGADADGRPHVEAPDGAARVELPVAAGRADLRFRATFAAGVPLTLEWRSGPRLVRLSSWAADGRHDLRLDLRRAGDGPAVLRVFDGARTVAEAPVPTGVEFPAGSSAQEPTSVHVYIDEHGNKVVVYDYDLQPGGGTELSSPALGLERAPASHVAVTLPPAATDPAEEHLAVGGARAITVYEAHVP